MKLSRRIALEEGGGGGDVMVREGIMDRFGITQVYGVHNAPGTPVGVISTSPALTRKVARNGVGRNGAPHGTSGSKAESTRNGRTRSARFGEAGHCLDHGNEIS